MLKVLLKIKGDISCIFVKTPFFDNHILNSGIWFGNSVKLRKLFIQLNLNDPMSEYKSVCTCIGTI